MPDDRKLKAAPDIYFRLDSTNPDHFFSHGQADDAEKALTSALREAHTSLAGASIRIVSEGPEEVRIHVVDPADTIKGLEVETYVEMFRRAGIPQLSGQTAMLIHADPDAPDDDPGEPPIEFTVD